MSAGAPQPHAVPQAQDERVLAVSDLRAWYQTRHFGVSREVRAVDGVSLQVARGEIYGLAGESSCGKSTLVKTIARAIRPPLHVVGGTVRFRFAGRERDIYALSQAELARMRWRHLSYILQGSMNVLNPVRRVRQSFVDFAYPHLDQPMPEFLALVEAHLARIRLDPAVLDSYPHALSGGMRQRVTIALASVCRPDFIIADEPTTALDVVVQKDVLGMLRAVQREIRSSMILVTHDIGVHAHVADRIGIMYAGRLVEEGPTRDVLRKARHPYTAHLVASLPRIGDDTPKQSLEGAPPNLADPPPGCRFHPRCPLATDICRKEAPPLIDVAAAHRAACWVTAPPAQHAAPGAAA
ncbi:MAG TPA: ABC transporter ATP-binding protein [Xanthobacteraceae bacterium]|nr:ABC transporter ATP-binding protein [Xanthobacteraceae bacterium]